MFLSNVKYAVYEDTNDTDLVLGEDFSKDGEKWESAAYFTEEGIMGREFEKIEVSEKLGIVRWPEDFFDHGLKDISATMNAVREKRKNT